MTKKMNAKELRQIAAGAARAECRHKGIPITVENAELVLDDLARIEPDKIAAQWWLGASERQWKIWRRELNQWIERHG